jgi:hypothetical protein
MLPIFAVLYIYEKVSHPERKQAFDNSAKQNMLPKRDEVTGRWRKLWII